MFQNNQISTITASGRRSRRRRLIHNRPGTKPQPAPISIRTLLDETDEAGALIISEDYPTVLQQEQEKHHLIVNLKPANSIRQLSHFLAMVNRNLRPGAYLVCCLETNILRKQRNLSWFPGVWGWLYHFLDYLMIRVLPAVKITRWFSTALSAGPWRALSYYEMVGRLIYCGFEVVADEEIDGLHYMAAKKVALPPPNPAEHYGLLMELPRVGMNGKVIHVYKFRTMVPFSEHAQDYIYQRNHLCRGGKFRNDRRVTRIGGIIRRYWLDEIPMLINLLKGEVKLIGVRPVSAGYLSLYRPEVREKRKNFRPGLFPPFYADLPSTLDEIQDSELRYLERWEQAPFRTDAVYFLKILWNIVFGGARSK